jgi:TonB family protein
MGIARVTLEDIQGNGVAERLIYVHYDKQAQIEITTDKEKYLPREKVAVTVSAQNSLGKPIAGDFSIAVTDDQLLSHADDNSSNLLSWMLVESELTGKIEKPEFYFDPKEEKAEKALDMLLLTHGWRRFVWRENTPADSFRMQAAERKEYKGIVSDYFTHQPIQGLKARLGEHSEWTEFESGEFQFDGDENRKQRIYFQAEGYKETSVLLYSYHSKIVWNMYQEIPPIRNNDTTRFFPLPTKPQSDFSKLPPPPPVEEIIPPPLKKVGFNIPPPPAPKPELKNENPQSSKIPEEDSPQSPSEIIVEDKKIAMDDLDIMEEEIEMESLKEEKREIGFDKSFHEPDINAFIVVSEEPQALNIEEVRRQIGYPDIAREAGIEGMVVVRVLVDEQGNYMKHVMLKKAHPILAQSVERFLPYLKFTPAIQGNRPIKFWVSIPFRFKLNDPFNPGGPGFIPVSSQLPIYQEREFAFPEYTETNSRLFAKTDFRSTLYWNPHLKLDSTGKGSFSFYASDAVSSYRITAEGFGEPGLPGRAEKLFYTLEPLQMDIRLPEALTQGDILSIPITLVNRYDYPVSGGLNLRTSHHLHKLEQDQLVELKPGEAKTWYYPVQANLAGNAEIYCFFNSYIGPLVRSQHVQIRERGFPVAWSHQELSHEATVQIPIRDHIDSSLHLSWVGYPNAMTEILDGMEAMLREPYGCFEQTSSATYPNILVLQLLRNTDRTSPDLERKALSYIEKGYKRLQGFEVGGGGFDWYGQGPAHEVLTAYGLMEFADMKTVWSGVDNSMMQRAVDWLRTRRNGKGGFEHQQRTFGTVNQRNQLGKDLYVAYSLVEAGFSEGFDKEIGYAIRKGLESSHPFLRAMAANILAKQENKYLAGKALEPLAGEAMTNEGMPLGMGGNSLQAGVFALRLLAMLEIGDFSGAELETLAHQLRRCRTHQGHFGTTQSTVMALRALSKYERSVPRGTAKQGIVSLMVNGEAVAGRSFSLREDSLIIRGLEAHVFSSFDKVSIQITGFDRPISWSLRASYKAKKPVASERQLLSLTLGNYPKEIKVGENCYVEARFKNLEGKRQASSMARIGIPAGLSPQLWQLKEWIETKRIAFYEWEKGYLTLYFYGMEPNQEIVLPLSLKADLPGRYTSLPSSSYLYYTPEFRTWLDPIQLEIIP